MNLRAIAERALRSNIVEVSGRHYLKAGGHQFESLWTRDFCFSVPGLILIGRADVARDHLQTLLDNARPSDYLVPRVLDTIRPQYRVIRASLGLGHFSYHGTLKPEYQDEHGTEAIDSNALVLIAAHRYATMSGDQPWLQKNQTQLSRLVDFYEKHLDQQVGLIRQTPFSDWQDSLRRSGFTSYTNLLYAQVLKLYRPGLASDFLDRLEKHFFDQKTGLYLSQSGQSTITLDVQLLGLRFGLFKKSTVEIYEKLKASNLWQNSKLQLPGFNTAFRYPSSEKTLAVRLAGLKNYHEDLYWSWLMAYSLMAAKIANDAPEIEKITKNLDALCSRDATMNEVFESQNLAPVKTRLYRSEWPFSWGASTCIEALEFNLKHDSFLAK